MSAELDGPVIIRGKPGTQTVKCGSAVLMNDNVLKNGICLVHPDLPLYMLFIKINPNMTLSYNFEKVKPDGPHIKGFEIEIVEDEPIIIQPKKELIIPERG